MASYQICSCGHDADQHQFLTTTKVLMDNQHYCYGVQATCECTGWDYVLEVFTKPARNTIASFGVEAGMKRLAQRGVKYARVDLDME